MLKLLKTLTRLAWLVVTVAFGVGVGLAVAKTYHEALEGMSEGELARRRFERDPLERMARQERASKTAESTGEAK